LKSLDKYLVYIFDCDGVILNSNQLKSEIFYKVAKRYSSSGADKLKLYSESINGFSRRQIFTFFATKILNLECDDPKIDLMVLEFSALAKDALLHCEMAKNLSRLRDKNSNSKWMVVSGGDEVELRLVFEQRQILKYFDLGVFGSPRSKCTILREEYQKTNITLPTILIGDSSTDYEVAKSFGFDFLFVGGWSDLSGWQNYCGINKIPYVLSLDEI
jgi:phosphoglycolate phosphatase-like HAD superfamily hydrolase